MDSFTIEVNGKEYEGFESIDVFKSVETACGVFTAVATSKKKDYLPFKGQEPTRVRLNGHSYINGYIELVNPSYSESGHGIIISGRDKTMDIVDSTIKGNIEFKSSVRIEDIFKAVISDVFAAEYLNINYFTRTRNEIKIINNETDLKQFSPEEIISNDVGENAFSFLEKYCRKRAVLFTCNGDGNIVITRAGRSLLNGTLINRLNDNQNNIKSANLNYDLSNRYNTYIVKSQANPSSSDFIADIFGEFEEVESFAIDDEIRNSRQLVIKAETSCTQESAQERANWEANIRRARSFSYQVSVRSLYTNDSSGTEIYEPNKKIRVIDDFNNINAILLIKSVKFTQSAKNGTNVILELVPQNSYLPEPVRPKKDELANLLGDALIEYAS